MIYLYILALIILFTASIFDFKNREVPDLLSYSFIASVIFLRLLFSFKVGFSFFIDGLIGILIFGAFGSILFYSGQWGGADVKILAALGGVLGFSLNLINPLTIFLACIAFAGSIYGITYTATLSAIHFDELKNSKKGLLKRWLLTTPLFLALVCLFLTSNIYVKIVLLLISIIPLLLLFISITKVLEPICFRKIIPVEELTEGDWIDGELKHEGKIIFKAKKEGLYKKDIEHLKQLKKEGIIEKVKIKIGMPFVPVFFLAFILFLIYVFVL